MVVLPIFYIRLIFHTLWRLLNVFPRYKDNLFFPHSDWFLNSTYCKDLIFSTQSRFFSTYWQDQFSTYRCSPCRTLCTASLESPSKWLDSKKYLRKKYFLPSFFVLFCKRFFCNPSHRSSNRVWWFFPLYATENNAWSFNASHLYSPNVTEN